LESSTSSPADRAQEPRRKSAWPGLDFLRPGRTADSGRPGAALDPIGDRDTTPADPPGTTHDVVPVAIVRAGVGRPTIHWREIARYSDLLFTLAWRDVRVRYKQTVLGILWVVLQPLLAAAIFSFVFGVIARMPSDGHPYMLVAFAGLLAWTLFSNVVLRSSTALVSNAHLITKVYFPREILPISTVLSSLLDFAVSMGVMAAMLAGFGVRPGLGVLLLPAWVAILVLMALGIGLMAGALMVRYRDVQHIIPVALSLGLYASPVAWSVAAVPARYRLVCTLNPLAGVFEAFRWSLFGGGSLDLPALAYGAVTALVIVWAGARTFRRMERRFADVI
jgi:lipopolysaccharide transport system permease protein